MAKKTYNVALIGYKFMGKAHSQAWREAPLFFDLADATPVLKVACGRHEEPLREFAERWGWEEIATDWREVVARDDIDIVDISAPTNLHYDIALAAAEAGKAIFCEKPFCLSVEQAEGLVAAVEKSGVLNYINHNYRRCPAVTYARRMIDDGKLGTLYHWRGWYLQDWIMDPNFPLTWHLQKEAAGAGPHFDLNSHSVDLAHYLVGDIASVQCMTANFIKERPLTDDVGAGTFSAGEQKSGGRMGEVTVDDAAFLIASFRNGALGSFESSRFAGGRKNFNCFEIYGSKGSLAFNLERMNELQYYNRDDPENETGFRTILVTESTHPYVESWWPPGHLIGYEHEFVHAVVDFVRAIQSGESIAPSFADGLKTMGVLDAGLRSAETGQRVDVAS